MTTIKRRGTVLGRRRMGRRGRRTTTMERRMTGRTGRREVTKGRSKTAKVTRMTEMTSNTTEMGRRDEDVDNNNGE